MDRTLREIVRADGSHDIVELSPGPYSFSSPKETVLFSMTVGEAAALAPADMAPEAKTKTKRPA